ncbi:dephospho-CoA kinase [Dongshaea marina]|uniref:dephospho-CoA kinase n=1 Tax=Dongshaea marina TaxID=2047966 RepID=UPI001EEB52BB|nr:dephospho-CoA kinase [Dongshaea marina]
MFIIGLTGGIGSGKTTVANFFAELGILCIDSDQIAREVVEPGTPALAEISTHFGPEVLEGESLNRRALRQKIFDEPQQKLWLEQLLHPLILQRMLELTDKALSPYCIWGVPLLFEQGWEKEVDRTLAIDVSEPVQIERACARDASSESQIRQIVASQLSREQRRQKADDLIDNDRTTLAQLKQKIIQLDHNYRELAQRSQDK